MKTLFIDCSMGAAGDMLTSALLELFDNKEEILNELNSLGLPDTEYRAQSAQSCGIVGTRIRVIVKGMEEGHSHHDEHTKSHAHHSLEDIKNIIHSTNADDSVKEKAVEVYTLLAEAESKVHGVEIDNIHFHEVGTLDAIADILAFCYLFGKLKVDYVVASPVNVGKGTVKCAHGILPVPAPATAELLKGVPIYSREDTDGEMCTPTGAALLKAFADTFSDLPKVSTEKIGYGMGTKDFGIANCVRMLLCESDDETVVEISFNVDDMTAEEIAFGAQELLNSGVKEVFTQAVTMKKGRLGTLITVLCVPEEKEQTVKLIFKHFSTIGLREALCKRYTMNRSIVEVETKLGTVRRKDCEGYGQTKSKYEYDDLARIAREQNLSIREVKEQLENGETK